MTSETGPIDAPEIHADGFAPAKCAREIERAKAARRRVVELMASGDWSIDRLGGRDSHNRSLAVVYVEGEDLAAILVREGHARPWPRPFKKNKPDWCAP
ncbi:thermonuclease family protein [Chenggangzhangella methanolivorans]